MYVKVDTGVQGNVIPLGVFSGMFPEYMDNNIPKVSVLEPYNNTKPTAYNGTSIPHYGTITLNCREKTDHGQTMFSMWPTPQGPLLLCSRAVSH